MAIRIVAAIMSLLCVGCAGEMSRLEPRLPRQRPVAKPVVSAPTKPKANQPEVIVVLEPNARSGRLNVRIATTRADLMQWTLPPAAVDEISVRRRDADENIAFARRGPSARQLTLQPRRDDSPPFAISYQVAPAATGPCPFELSPDRVVFCGGAALAIPTRGDGDDYDVELRLIADGTFYKSAASSFGLATTQRLPISFEALGRAGFLFGDIQHARFEAAEGRDHAAWLGFFSFDPRWVAAETAGLRTFVDRWLGIRRPPDDATVGLLFVSSGDASQRVQVDRLYRGALIQAGPSALWSLRSRLDLARRLVQRTIGAAVSLDHPGSAWWFDEGVAHGIALRALLDFGVVTDREAAAEVSAWLAEEALSTHAGAPLATLRELAAKAVDHRAARRLLAIRGALLSVALNGDHERGKAATGAGLRRTVRRLLAHRSKTDGTLTDEAFFAAASAEPSGPRVASIREAFDSGQPIPLRPSCLSPCVTMARRRVYDFDLGFTASGTSTRHDSIATVDPAGPAARAGVRSGDTIVMLDYVADRTDVAAKLELERAERAMTVAYLPRGRSRTARAFVHAANRKGCRVLD